MDCPIDSNRLIYTLEFADKIAIIVIKKRVQIMMYILSFIIR